MEEEEVTAAWELDDDQLSGAVGGARFAEVNGTLYQFVGDGSDEDFAKGYVCPNCGSPVHYSAWLRFYCDSCNGNWCYESDLVPNLQGGMWKAV